MCEHITPALRRRIPAVLVASVAAAVAAGGITVASASPSSQAGVGQQSIQLVARDQGSNFVDNPPRGDSMGYIGVFNQALYRDGKPYGHGELYFVETAQGSSQGDDTVEATGSFLLPGGEISGHGAIRAGAQAVTIPITGGTGAYRNVRG